MKKLIFISAVAVMGAISMTSCNKKKDWTCKCTYDTGGTTLTQEYPLLDQTKKDAEKICSAADFSLPGANISCELK